MASGVVVSHVPGRFAIIWDVPEEKIKGRTME